ncbi:tannase and feruloyl esterase [Cadophora sp. DSE1049]|nr:tannase and feruloyl esterase [Cadophora sp. DSE1049]
MRSFQFLSLLASTVSACKNLTCLTGIADTSPWAISTSTAANIGNLTYCSLTATIDSRITVWLLIPSPQTWNGRYVQIGCGGACGYNALTNSYFPINSTLSQGYALATTDMGVPTSTSNFDPMHINLQMRIDWGFLATHLTAVMGKQIVESYYGREVEFAYHLGSSTGGRQGLVEAQRYPEDFKGVFAIAPAYNETGVTTYSIAWNARAMLVDEVGFEPAMTNAEAEVIHGRVLEECDGLDGLVDGIVSLPRRCHPDIESLVCELNETTNRTCISQMALNAAKKVYSGPVSLTGHKQVPEGLLPGSEVAWKGTYIPSTAGQPSAWYTFAKSFLSYYAFWPDPVMPVTPFSVNLTDPSLIKQTSKTESLEYGGVADMSKFHLLGGKMIMTQGLQDVAVAPGFAKDLYERVGFAMGSARDDFFRFFEMPGVNHVSGGPGADQYDALDVLVDWVENGVAPEVIVASHLGDDGSVEFTRPLYRYPMVAMYDGVGDPTSWESFGSVGDSEEFWNL